jgi:mRNA-degrading endonuclease toxin of MazEF toxin-antitoxin module
VSIQRGEIYFVNLNPVQGREQAGQRPVLVLSIAAKYTGVKPTIVIYQDLYR